MRLERNVGQLTNDMTELKDLAVELVEEMWRCKLKMII